MCGQYEYIANGNDMVAHNVCTSTSHPQGDDKIYVSVHKGYTYLLGRYVTIMDIDWVLIRTTKGVSTY